MSACEMDGVKPIVRTDKVHEDVTFRESEGTELSLLGLQCQ
jgi:hypothetical protein